MIFLQHLHNTSLTVRNTSGTPKQRGHMKHATIMSQNNHGHRKQGKSETLAQPKGAFIYTPKQTRDYNVVSGMGSCGGKNIRLKRTTTKEI